jgi:hypothetical protein
MSTDGFHNIFVEKIKMEFLLASLEFRTNYENPSSKPPQEEAWTENLLSF